MLPKFTPSPLSTFWLTLSPLGPLWTTPFATVREEHCAPFIVVQLLKIEGCHELSSVVFVLNHLFLFLVVACTANHVIFACTKFSRF